MNNQPQNYTEDFNEVEFLRAAWEIYQEEMDSRSDDDYEPNEIQMKKLLDAYAFFQRICEKSNGSVEKLELIPHEEYCGITAYFTLFYLYGDDLAEFSQIVGNMSAICIDAMLDGTVCISFNIPKVYYKKS